MTRLCSLPVVVCALLLAVACGDDDDGNNTGQAGTAGGAMGGTTAGRGGSSAANGGSSGDNGTGNGTLTEGKLCDSTAECASGLRCSISAAIESDGQLFGIRVCARGCTSETDCEDGELCESLTNSQSDALCFNRVETPFAPCGPSDTSVCGDAFECVPVDTGDDRLLGACVQLCALPGAAEEDLPACPADLSCVPAFGEPDIGTCAKLVERGEACGVELGAWCANDDFCIGNSSGAKCYQDCTQSQMCEAGKTCTMLDDGDSFCQ